MSLREVWCAATRHDIYGMWTETLGVRQCTFVDLPRISDARGSLTFIEGSRHVPFEVRRVYYLYDVPSGVNRGGHGHRALEQLMIAVSGAFDVLLDDGNERRLVRLDRADRGLYV